MQAVNESITALLHELVELPFLKSYYLAGGTNLAVRYNHRTSIDIDLFTFADFSLEAGNRLNIKLKDFFGNRCETKVSEVGVFAYIDDVKVDFVNYPHEMLEPVEKFNGLLLANTLDIAAMKINAITGRGSRKDFFDIHKLLEFFTLAQMMQAYQKKYKIDHISHAKMSLTYFTNAGDTSLRDNQFMPVDHNPGWENIKHDIVEAVRELNRSWEEEE